MTEITGFVDEAVAALERGKAALLADIDKLDAMIADLKGETTTNVRRGGRRGKGKRAKDADRAGPVAGPAADEPAAKPRRKYTISPEVLERRRRKKEARLAAIAAGKDEPVGANAAAHGEGGNGEARPTFRPPGRKSRW